MTGVRILGAEDLEKYFLALPRAVAEEMKKGVARAQLMVQASIRRHASGLSVGKGSDIAPTRGKLAQSWQIGAVEVHGLTDVRGSVGSNMPYAAIHEFGGTIRPVNVKWLTIPVSPIAVRKRARDFENTFFQRTLGGQLFLMRKAGGKRSEKIELLYVLKKSVSLRARHYVSNALKEADPQLTPIMGRGITAAITGQS